MDPMMMQMLMGPGGMPGMPPPGMPPMGGMMPPGGMGPPGMQSGMPLPMGATMPQPPGSGGPPMMPSPMGDPMGGGGPSLLSMLQQPPRMAPAGIDPNVLMSVIQSLGGGATGGLTTAPETSPF